MCSARTASSLFALWLSLVALPTRAEDDVQALIERGTAALRAERGGEARAAFVEGLTIARAPTDRWRMHLGLALSHELSGELIEATYAYRAFLRDSARHPDAGSSRWQNRRRSAVRDLARLEDTILEDHAKIDLQTDPPGATVLLDGERLEHRTPAIVYLLPGPHRLELTHDDHQPTVISIVLEQGQEPLIHRRLVPLLSTVPTVPPPSVHLREDPAPVPATDDGEHVSLAIPGAVLAATAGAALLTAGLLHGVALRDAAEVRRLSEGEVTDEALARDDQLRERITDYQRGYASLYAVGGAAAATAAGLLVYEAVTGDAGGRHGVRIRVDPTGGGLSVGGAF